MFVKKGPLDYQKVIKTYLPTYIWDRSVIIDSCDSSDISDSSDSSEGSDSSDSRDKKCCDKKFVTLILWLKCGD